MDLHIALVDDDPSILKLLAVTLRNTLGCKVSCFGDAESFLESDARAGCQVVVSDLTMPGRTGAELARELGGTPPRVILLTAIDSANVPTEGVAAVLIKPCRAAKLVETIRQVAGLEADARRRDQPPAIDALTQRYRQHLASERDRWAGLVAAASASGGLHALRDALHRLAGTCGSYGMPVLMERALTLRARLAAGEPFEDEGRALLAQLDLEVAA
ncbi:MAG: response regulator [Archangium sp.]